MADLSAINNVITSSVDNGDYSVEINLSDYTNILGTTALIILPVLLEKISFLSIDPTEQYNFSIVVAAGRTKDIEIYLSNAFINSGDNIGIDLRGDSKNNSYINRIRFSLENTIKSSNSIGILVMNGQSLEVIGEEKGSILNVHGGAGNCAVGNSNVFNSGGQIVFSGQGTVSAHGGDAIDQPAYNVAMDGGAGVGFVESTSGNSSVLIKCNAIVNVFGGNGQECDVSNPNSMTVGNGGPGISLGKSGILIVERCPDISTSLTVFGGNGGLIIDSSNSGAMTDLRIGGNGGSAVILPSGTVDLLGSVQLRGGDGTTVESHGNLPIVGGDGGSAVKFIGTTTARNTFLSSNEAVLSGGNGGTSGVYVDFDTSSIRIISSKGGRGGHSLFLGSNSANVQIDGSILASGEGGQGGSPKAYLDNNNLDLDTLKNTNGANEPGSGGSDGSSISGTGAVNLNMSESTILNAGTIGSGGFGIESDGSLVEGESGTTSKPVDIITNPSPHFGYININRIMDFSLNYNNNLVDDKEYDKALINIKNLFISQTVDSCLNIDSMKIQSYYKVDTPNEILGNAFMDLIVNFKVNAYVREIIPIICKKSDE
ncbi:hemagglutinin [Clostridium butyricum]|uniref:hemagglutinin n=1 Tax=Clostridium butyricum TaxID=1492 RepID=UPI000A74C65E|nr:hemagglutinin [Clostridium butyricum]MDM8130421.1 hemagglutinin [Clostridium butyricum]MDM8229782.1 hemagglutinin [Clostridium butyricum]MDP0839999.1 hemagglutinin [Clostridium butyricum]WLS69455.1 hemagglutinin [Clostridium butyricum]